MAPGDIETPDGYHHVLTDLKLRVRAAQRRAGRAVQNEMVGLYWSIGKTILEQQQESGWGAKVVTRLAEDLRAEFPETRGFNIRNLLYMRSFAAAWPSNVPQPVAHLPWGHVRLLLDRLDNASDREWYAAESAANGWTRAVLEHQIMNRLRPRIGAAPTNFEAQLEPADAVNAQSMIKDPFVFDFLGLSRGVAERDGIFQKLHLPGSRNSRSCSFRTSRLVQTSLSEGFPGCVLPAGAGSDMNNAPASSSRQRRLPRACGKDQHVQFGVRSRLTGRAVEAPRLTSRLVSACALEDAVGRGATLSCRADGR